jgi:hypothetical protein
MTVDFSRPGIVHFDSAPIPVNQVLRRLGYPQGGREDVDPGIGALLDEEMRRAEGLFSPGGVCRFLKTAPHAPGRVAFENSDFTIQSRQVARMLSAADVAVVFMVTIGPGLEAAMDGLLKAGETTNAFILDAIGSETADALADELHWNRLKAEADRLGYSVTPRFSPGYGDWSLEAQAEIMQLCGGGRIGLSLTPSFLMVPQKSVSAVLGWKRKE